MPSWRVCRCPTQTLCSVRLQPSRSRAVMHPSESGTSLVRGGCPAAETLWSSDGTPVPRPAGPSAGVRFGQVPRQWYHNVVHGRPCGRRSRRVLRLRPTVSDVLPGASSNGCATPGTSSPATSPAGRSTGGDWLATCSSDNLPGTRRPGTAGRLPTSRKSMVPR